MTLESPKNFLLREPEELSSESPKDFDLRAIEVSSLRTRRIFRACDHQKSGGPGTDCASDKGLLKKFRRSSMIAEVFQSEVWMQGRQEFQPQLFSEVNVERLVPSGHILRRLDKILDLDFVRSATRNFYAEQNGRPSIDPELFFRMQIIFYLYGIKSERQLCEQVSLNIAFRWFCRLNLDDQVPDHSSMTRIRDRFGEALFKDVFESLVDRWKKNGIIKGQSLIADSSLIEADASLDTMEDAVSDDGEKIQINKTDPDATKVGRAKFSGHVYHKNHCIIDADSRIITDCHITTGSVQDCTVITERVAYQKQRFGFNVQEVIADTGYGTGPVLNHFKEQNIEAFISTREHNSKWRRSVYEEDGFFYDWDKQTIKCPEGHFLYPHNKTYRGSIKFRMLGKHCKGCPQENRCLPPTQKHRALFIDLSIHEKAIELTRRKMLEPQFKAKMHERKWKIEGIFGEAKTSHGMRRAKFRRRAKVQVQILLTAIVQNYKRVLARGLSALPEFPSWIFQAA